MVVAGRSGKFHFGRVPNVVRIEPSNHILVKQARHHRHSQIEHIINGEHGLHEVVFARSKVLRRGMDLQHLAILLHAKTIERHLEKCLSLAAVELAAALLQVLYNVPIVR